MFRVLEPLARQFSRASQGKPLAHGWRIVLIPLKLPALVHVAVTVLVLGNFGVVGDVGVGVLPRAVLLMDRLTLLHEVLDNARLFVAVLSHHAYLRIVALRPYLLYLLEEYIALGVRYHQVTANVIIPKRFHAA